MTETLGAQQTQTEERAILAVLRQFSRAFDTFDTEAFMSTWDDRAESIVYQPEETREAIFDLETLRGYFSNLPKVIRAMRDVKVIDLQVQTHGDTALVYVRFWCRISFARVVQTSDGQIRQSFILRRRDDGWKLIHYHESRQAVGFEEAVGEW